jgi:hypothetical protein
LGHQASADTHKTERVREEPKQLKTTPNNSKTTLGSQHVRTQRPNRGRPEKAKQLKTTVNNSKTTLQSQRKRTDSGWDE